MYCLIYIYVYVFALFIVYKQTLLIVVQRLPGQQHNDILILKLCNILRTIPFPPITSSLTPLPLVIFAVLEHLFMCMYSLFFYKIAQKMFCL